MNKSTTDFLPYKKTDFFFYNYCNLDDNTCNSVSCNNITYDNSITSTDINTQYCLNANLFTNLNKIQQNNGSSEQRNIDLTHNKKDDLIRVAYNILGIYIMIGIIFNI